MEKIIVKPKRVRGLGNIIAQKTSNDFELINSLISTTTEEVNGENTNVFKIQSSTPRYTIVLACADLKKDIGLPFELIVSVNADGNPVEGATVTFYDGNNSIGTETTNSSGNATLELTATTMGVHTYTAEYNDIQSNSVDLTVPTISDIVVTSDKDILSYADGDTAYIHATLWNEDDTMSHAHQVQVEFYKCDSQGNFISTIKTTTTSIGMASLQYHSTGSGDVYIRARTQGVGSFVSEIYEVEDCIGYCNDNQIKSNWDKNTSSISGRTVYTLDTGLTDNVEYTFKYLNNIPKGVIGFNIYSPSIIRVAMLSVESRYYAYYNNQYSSLNISPTVNDVFRIRIENHTAYWYLNNTLILTQQLNSNYQLIASVESINSTPITIDYVKIKAL